MAGSAKCFTNVDGVASQLKQFIPQPVFGCDSPLNIGADADWLNLFGTKYHAGLSLTDSGLFMIITIVTIGALMAFGASNPKLVPNRIQAFVEMLYDMVFGFMNDMLGAKAKTFFPIIFAVFLYVLLGNVWGMMQFPIPGWHAFTFTSHIAVTGFMAVFLFGLVIILAIRNQGLIGWLAHFVPGGAPWYILPILVPIEVISYFVRPITLSLRLFANMMAGHVALKVFGSFSSLGLSAGIGMGIVGTIGGMLLILPITMLEFLVAGLQAYVFAILTTSYIMDSVNDHH